MQDTITKCLGWVTQYNTLGTAKGALAKALNVVCRRENIFEDRRGYAAYGSALATSAGRLMAYSNRILAANGTVISYDSNGAGTWANYTGSYNPPSGYRTRFAQANSNLYFTSDVGIQALVDLAGTAARKAGAPRPLHATYTLTGAPGTFLANAFQCAYRTTLQRVDANKNVLTSYPSPRLWVANTAGATRDVSFTQYLPSEAIAGDYLNVYRTAQVSGTSSDTALDEEGLVYSYKLQASDISAGFVTFTDSVIDGLIGAKIYTAPSQQGIAQANDRPPLAKCIALYRSNYMLYGNTSTKQRLSMSLVGTSGLSGKTITLAGVTYNFGATEIVSGGGSPQIKVYSTGVPAADIENTARSIVNLVNRYAGNTLIDAFYQSGPDDLPGFLLFQERGIGGSSFTINGSDTAIAAMFSPGLPVSPATSTDCTSSNEVRKNALYSSKYQELEHCPTLQYQLVGPANTEILEVIALRDSAIIVKEEGIYRLTGQSYPFVIEELDLTIKCKARNSIRALANQVFMYAKQGVVAISDTGGAVKSRDVSDQMLPLPSLSNLDSLAVGASYETEGMYFFSVPSTSTDTGNTLTYVYNIFTNTWTKWGFGFSDALVEESTDKLFLVKSSDTQVYRERKDFLDSDYADPDYAITITAIDTVAGTITFTSSSPTPQPGWVITQGGTDLTIESVPAAVGGIFTATMSDTIPASWATGAGTLYPHVGAEAEWTPWANQNPLALKQASAVQIIADPVAGNSTTDQLEVYFRSNFDSDEDPITIDAQGIGWGGGAWGEFEWGGSGGSGFPTWVPRNKQYHNLLSIGVRHKRARRKMAIAALGITFEMASQEVGR